MGNVLSKIQEVNEKYEWISEYLNEKSRRIWAATEANSIGWGGITIISKATGIDTKTKEGANHPDRDKQFKYINNQVKMFQKSNSPTLSVDTKKKENIGNYKNNGREYSNRITG